MSITLQDNIRIEANKLVDDRSKKPDGSYYISKAEVLSTIILSRRSLGLIVYINGEMFYFKTGVTNESDIVPVGISTVSDQDNIPKNKKFDYSGARSKANFAALVNGVATFTVSDKEIYVYSTYNSAVSPANEVQFIFMLINVGKGSYGLGGTQITAANIMILDESRPSVLDNLSTQTINLGDIGSLNVSDGLNQKNPSISIQMESVGTRIIKAIISGFSKTYLFIGTGGNYGLGQTQSVLENFIETEDSSFISNFVPYTEFIYVRKGWGNTLPIYQAGDIFEGWMSETYNSTRAVWNGIYPLVAANMSPFVYNGYE